MTAFDGARNEWPDDLAVREEEWCEGTTVPAPEQQCTWWCAARIIVGVALAAGVMALIWGLLVSGGVE